MIIDTHIHIIVNEITQKITKQLCPTVRLDKNATA